MVGHRPIILVAYRFYAFIKTTIANCNSYSNVTFHLQCDDSKDSWRTRWWWRICSHTKEQISSISNLNPVLTGNLITLIKENELVYFTLLKSWTTVVLNSLYMLHFLWLLDFKRKAIFCFTLLMLFNVKLKQKEMFGAFHLVACGNNVKMGWLVKKNIGVMRIKLKFKLHFCLSHIRYIFMSHVGCLTSAMLVV